MTNPTSDREAMERDLRELLELPNRFETARTKCPDCVEHHREGTVNPCDEHWNRDEWLIGQGVKYLIEHGWNRGVSVEDVTLPDRIVTVLKSCDVKSPHCVTEHIICALVQTIEERTQIGDRFEDYPPATEDAKAEEGNT